MKSFDYEAVTYDGAVYCVECLPDGVTMNSDEVSPIFADSEWDSAPVCDACGAEHDYVTVLESDDEDTDDDNDDETEPTEPEEGDYTTTDHKHFYQYGKLVLDLDEDDDHIAALNAHMDREQFWPNAWFISDHGNAHLMTLVPEGATNEAI